MYQTISYHTVAVVGLEETVYNVSEGVGAVELCAVVFIPTIDEDCPISFQFEVNLLSNNGSAGITVYVNIVVSM